MTLRKLNPTEAELVTLAKADQLVDLAHESDVHRAEDFTEAMKPTELPPPADIQF